MATISGYGPWYGHTLIAEQTQRALDRATNASSLLTVAKINSCLIVYWCLLVSLNTAWERVLQRQCSSPWTVTHKLEENIFQQRLTQHKYLMTQHPVLQHPQDLSSSIRVKKEQASAALPSRTRAGRQGFASWHGINKLWENMLRNCI